jgi:hypothetical protein
MFANVKTNTEQGNIGEARAIYDLTRLGYVISKPLFVNTKYDLIVDDGKRLFRVSVKTSGHRKGSGYEVTLATKGGNSKVNTIRGRQKEDWDMLFVLVENGDSYLIPSEHLGDAKHAIVVGRTKYNEFKLGCVPYGSL